MLKVKALIEGDIRKIKSPPEVKSITQLDYKKSYIQAIQCPYFESKGKTYYEFALYKADYAVVSWSVIKFPETVLQKETV